MDIVNGMFTEKLFVGKIRNLCVCWHVYTTWKCIYVYMHTYAYKFIMIYHYMYMAMPKVGATSNVKTICSIGGK